MLFEAGHKKHFHFELGSSHSAWVAQNLFAVEFVADRSAIDDAFVGGVRKIFLRLCIRFADIFSAFETARSMLRIASILFTIYPWRRPRVSETPVPMMRGASPRECSTTTTRVAWVPTSIPVAMRLIGARIEV